MALPLPDTSKDVTQRAKVDVRRELSRSDPFVRRSYLGAIVVGLCNRVFEYYLALREVELESNPATAIRNLHRWASIWKIYTLPGSAASGALWVQATAGAIGTVLAAGTRFVSSAGNVYLSTSDTSIETVSGAISALSASGGIATATRVGHGLASNAVATISGATQAGFNLADVLITVTSKDQFTYEVGAGLSGSATGSPVVSSVGAAVVVVSEGAGSQFGLEADAPVSFESGPPANVSSPAFVAAPGIADGSDVESDDAKRARMLFRIRNPTAHFNPASITAKATEIGGVTRVYVQPVTPAVGQATIYFLRDDDASPIPSAAEVAAVKTKILEIKPVEMSDSDVIVAAPTAVVQNFTFSAISPSTASMKAAVKATLADFFRLKTSVGVSVPQDAYRSAIFNTRDPVTGDPVASFTLSAPTGAITISTGEIAMLGTVSI